MKIVVNFHVGQMTVHTGGGSRALARIERKLDTIMGVLDDMRVVLGEINVATDEIAADVEDLMDKVVGGLTADEAAEVGASLGAIRDRLKGVAEEWPMAAPVDEPPVEEPPA